MKKLIITTLATATLLPGTALLATAHTTRSSCDVLGIGSRTSLSDTFEIPAFGYRFHRVRLNAGYVSVRVQGDVSMCGDEVTYLDFEVFDANGSMVASSTEIEDYQEVDLSVPQSTYYLIKVIGDSGTEYQLIVTEY